MRGADDAFRSKSDKGPCSTACFRQFSKLRLVQPKASLIRASDQAGPRGPWSHLSSAWAPVIVAATAKHLLSSPAGCIGGLSLTVAPRMSVRLHLHRGDGVGPVCSAKAAVYAGSGYRYTCPS